MVVLMPSNFCNPTNGQHGIYNAQPFRNFDADAYMVNLPRHLGTRGRDVTHRSGWMCSNWYSQFLGVMANK